MFKRTLAKIRRERSGKKPSQNKRKKKPMEKPRLKKVIPKKSKQTKKEVTEEEVKTPIEEKHSIKEEQEQETEPPLLTEMEKEENKIIEEKVYNMTLEQKEIPLMKFEGNVSAPLLRYDIPSPSSYEGRNYIELRDLKIDNKEIPFNNMAYHEPTPEDFIEANRESIYEYLKATKKEDMERNFYLVFDLDEIQLTRSVLQYPGTYTFESDIIGLEPEGWIEKGKLEGITHQIISEKAGHKNVLQIRDEGSGDLQYYLEFEKQERGTIEFWTYQDTDTWVYINIEEDFKNGISLNLGRTNYYYTNRDRINIHIQGGLAGNLWHHHKLIFDVKANNGKGVFDWYIDNGIDKSRNLIFMNNLTGVNRFEIGSTSGAKNIIAYIDAIGFSWDENYNVGDNLARREIEIKKQEIIDTSQHVDPKLMEMLKTLDTDISFGAKYRIFKYFIQSAMTAGDNRRMPIFYRTMGGHLRLKFVRVPEDPNPRLMLIETYKLTTFPGDYGAGTTIKTFSLLPKEETEISIKTWKKSIATTKEASSILDSYTEDKADEFENSVQNENSNTSRVEESTSYHAEVSASAGWGVASVKASAGIQGSSSSAREEFAKNVMNSTSKHSQTASAKREVNIDTSYESTEETGEEVIIMRRIENLNASRTLNFTFRQMNQQYHSLLHLIDVRIAFYNGFPGSMKEYSLFELGDLVEEYLIPETIILGEPDLPDIGDEQEGQAITVASSNPTIPYDEIEDKLRGYILAEYKTVFDFQGTRQELVEEVTLNGSNGDDLKYIRIVPPTERIVEQDGEEVKLKVGQQKYIIREEVKDENGNIIQPEDYRYVDGIIVGSKVLTMRTDGIIVESLLGQANALDSFAIDARREKIKEESYENKLKLANVAKIRAGVRLINELIDKNQHDKAITAYKKIFGVQEGLRYFGEIFNQPNLEIRKKID